MSNELVLDCIDEALSFPDEGAEYKLRQARFRQWGYDGKRHLFSKASLAFPIGCVGIVRKVLRKQRYKVRLTDKRKNLPQPGKAFDLSIELREYQQEGVNDFVEHERGILQQPTGAGKTFTAAGVIAALGGPKTLFITHKRNLAHQTREALAHALGWKVEKIGLIGGGVWEPKQVTVAILQTLSSSFHLPAKIDAKAGENEEKREKMLAEMKRLKALLKATDLLILDECHHAAATTWKQMADRCPARWRLGLSGTPMDREDGKSPLVIAATGPVLNRVRAKKLIREGKIAKPFITFVPIIQVERGKSIHLYQDAIAKDADWHTAYSEGVVNNAYRNWKAITLAKENPGPVLILVNRIGHCVRLRQMAKKLGVSTRVAHGKLPVEKQKRRLQNFKDGKIKRLIATTELFGEGTDIPAIRTVIVCDGGKSPIRTLQRIGRGMRMFGDKKFVLVYDFLDETHRILLKHSKARIKTCQREYDVEVEKV